MQNVFLDFIIKEDQEQEEAIPQKKYTGRLNKFLYVFVNLQEYTGFNSIFYEISRFDNVYKSA